MHLNIKNKIILASISLISVSVVIILFILQGQHKMATIMTDVEQNNMAAMRTAEQIKHSFTLYDDYIFRYLATDDDILLKESKASKEKTSKWISKMKSIVQNEVERSLISEIEKDIDRYYMNVKELLDTYQFKTKQQKRAILEMVMSVESGKFQQHTISQNKKRIMTLLSAEGRTRLTRIYSQCEKLIDINRARLEDAKKNMYVITKKSKSSAVLAGIVMILFISGIALLLGFSIISPIYQLLTGVKKVTDGDLSLELPINSSDEIGKLTSAFNTMTRNLRKEREKLVTETITDQLTKLYNFRYFQQYLKDEISRATRYNHSFALLIIDIDDFKHYNDHNGHQMGNVILKDIAKIMSGSLRREDFIARYGGEEFVLILPETKAESAKAVAERLRFTVENSDLPGQEKQPIGKITISVGGAIFPTDGIVSKQIIEKADRALYKAKNQGKNQVCWSNKVQELN